MSQIDLALEQWTNALEALSEITGSAADIGLSADPGVPLSPAMQEAVSVAMDTVSERNGLDPDGPKAVVIAAESFSFEGFKKFMQSGIEKIVAFLKRIVQRVLDFVKGVDDEVGKVVETLKEYDDAFWARVDEAMGREPKGTTASTSEVENTAPRLSAAVGNQQIKDFTAYEKALEDYLVVIPLQFKLLERDSDLINGLFGAVGHFGKLNAKEGIGLVTSVTTKHKNAVQPSAVEKNADMFGGLTVKLVSRPDNLGVQEAEVLNALQSVQLLDIEKHNFEAVPVKLPTSKELRNAMRSIEKISKYFVEKKQSFSQFSEEMLKKAEELQKALESELAKYGPEDHEHTASLMMGQKTVAVLMWVISRYVNAGNAFFNAGRNSVKEYDRYLKAMIKALNVDKGAKQ